MVASTVEKKFLGECLVFDCGLLEKRVHFNSELDETKIDELA